MKRSIPKDEETHTCKIMVLLLSAAVATTAVTVAMMRKRGSELSHDL